MPVGKQGDHKNEGSYGTQAITAPEHTPFIHAINIDAGRGTKQQGRETKTNNSESNQGGWMCNLLDKHEQGVVWGVEDGHGD